MVSLRIVPLPPSIHSSSHSCWCACSTHCVAMSIHTHDIPMHHCSLHCCTSWCDVCDVWRAHAAFPHPSIPIPSSIACGWMDGCGQLLHGCVGGQCGGELCVHRFHLIYPSHTHIAHTQITLPSCGWMRIEGERWLIDGWMDGVENNTNTTHADNVILTSSECSKPRHLSWL